jgi:hypothetical protein
VRRPGWIPFVGLVALGLALAARPATAAVPCSADLLVGAVEPFKVNLSRLQIAIAAANNWQTPPSGLDAATWPTVRDKAIADLAACSGLQLPQDNDKAKAQEKKDNFGRQMRSAWKDGGFEQLRLAAAREAHPSDPVLQPVLAPGGTIPAPQRLQFGLAQVVSGGQPGMLASATGLLDADSRNHWKRHTSVAASVLVVQPTAAGASTTGVAEPATPEVGAMDIGVLYSSAPTIYDWTDSLTNLPVVEADEDAFAVHAWNVTNDFLATFSQKMAAGGQQAQDALRDAVTASGSAYFDATNVMLKARVTKPLAGPTACNFAFRFRASPNAAFVPELPDLLSLQGSWTGEVGQDEKLTGAYVRMSWTVAGSFSSLPTERYATWNLSDIGKTLGGVGDASLGAVAALPMVDQASPTRVEVAGIFRYSKHEGDGQGAGDFSGGGHAQLSVPVGGGIALVGTYTLRYDEARRWITTASFTLAKSVK